MTGRKADSLGGPVRAAAALPVGASGVVPGDPPVSALGGFRRASKTESSGARFGVDGHG